VPEVHTLRAQRQTHATHATQRSRAQPPRACSTACWQNRNRGLREVEGVRDNNGPVLGWSKPTVPSRGSHQETPRRYHTATHHHTFSSASFTISSCWNRPKSSSILSKLISSVVRSKSPKSNLNCARDRNGGAQRARREQQRQDEEQQGQKRRASRQSNTTTGNPRRRMPTTPHYSFTHCLLKIRQP
jgi:hypothetical protein